MKAKIVAGPTGLEPATSGVTGQRSNQLNYSPARTTKTWFTNRSAPSVTAREDWWAVQDSNL